MGRLALGVVIASIAAYIWGFFFWALAPFHALTWNQPVNEEQAMVMIKEHFPKTGTYHVPHHEGDEDKIQERYKKGPVAFVHVLSLGREAFDPNIMMRGFFHNLVCIILMTIVLYRAAPALPTYAQRVTFMSMVGLTSAVFIDFGDCIWWEMSWPWKTYNVMYHWTFWVVVGLSVSAFVSKSPTQTNE